MKQPSCIKIADDEIFFGIFNLDYYKTYLSSFLEILSDEEKNRAERYKFERDKLHYIISHGILRKILSLILNCNPKLISIDISDEGKPFLDTPEHCDLKFNLSHSNGMLFLALTRHDEIGVDIEYIKATRNLKDIIKRFFSPDEYKQYLQLPEAQKLAAFYFGWTCKEAFVKAIGSGVTESFSQFSVNMNPSLPATILSIPESCSKEKNWHIQQIDSPLDFQAAICWQGHTKKLQLFDAFQDF